MIFIKVKNTLIFLVLMPLPYSCVDESIGQTKLTLDYTTDGLELELSGNVVNSSYAIASVSIDWGEDGPLTLVAGNFDSINETHKYDNEGLYNVITKAITAVGDTSIEQQEITVSFTPTSLVGIRQTMYKAAANEYLFLTLNLHTYQEEDQLQKLNMIIDVIGSMDVDFISFQECAQHKSAKLINENIREDNMAYLIIAGLQKKYGKSYDFIWDWSHYGWNVWEEGVAVLSKYPIIAQEARYVSSATSKNNIEARKVIYGASQLPNGSNINLFSAHLHWRKSLTDQEQNNQIRNLQAMVDEKSTSGTYSFVSGDFNGNPTSNSPWSEGYLTMVDNGSYIDTYLEANADANNKPAMSKHYTVLGDFPGRIDYIFMKTNPDFTVIDSQIIFKPSVVGVVSDHYGVITKVKQNN